MLGTRVWATVTFLDVLSTTVNSQGSRQVECRKVRGSSGTQRGRTYGTGNRCIHEPESGYCPLCNQSHTPLFTTLLACNNNNNNRDNVYGAVIMTKVIARVHPVHPINVD